MDRDSSALRFVRDLVEEIVFCSVDSVVTGMAAFERGLTKNYDLVIADFQMHDLSGPLVYELLGKVYATAQPFPKEMPPIVYLCAAEERKQAEALNGEPGVRGVLVKPITVDRLIQVVRKALPEDAFRQNSPLIN